MMDSECIEWTGYRLPSGYGQTRVKGRGLQRAHRVAWEEVHGPIPEGMYVCHRCDNPPCVNVDHLFLGTPVDNATDMTSKERHASQRKTHCSKGHPYDDENTRQAIEGRRCRTCRKEECRAYRARAKTATEGTPL